jgi:anti-sigma factor RsiW
MSDVSFDSTNCEAIVRRMWPHLDGALSEADRAAITRHLEGCGACSSHFTFAQSFLEAVHEAKPDPADFDRVLGKVVRALAAEGFVKTP